MTYIVENRSENSINEVVSLLDIGSLFLIAAKTAPMHSLFKVNFFTQIFLPLKAADIS